MHESIKSIKQKIKKRFFQPHCPDKIRDNFTILDEIAITHLQASLESNFFSNESQEYLSSRKYEKDIREHMDGVLELNRTYIIPWLNNIRELDGARILEIGCGTGATSVTLAEQGASVVGLDIDKPSLKVAFDRCNLHKLNVDIRQENATEICRLFSKGDFDFIIFYASLEHMTYTERLVTLADAWSLLQKNGLLCVIEAPNRLWYFDSHTSKLPFYNWLPDDIAIKYSRFSPRQKFSPLGYSATNENFVELMRWGRGVSYHEFELAIENINLDSNVSCSSDFVRRQRVLSWLKWFFSKERRYEKILQSVKPGIHSGFFQPYLNIAILKP